MRAVVSLHETRGGSHPRHHLLEQRMSEPSSCSRMIHSSSEKNYSYAGKDSMDRAEEYDTKATTHGLVLILRYTRICPRSSRPEHTSPLTSVLTCQFGVLTRLPLAACTTERKIHGPSVAPTRYSLMTGNPHHASHPEGRAFLDTVDHWLAQTLERPCLCVLEESKRWKRARSRRGSMTR